jgi:hypothetical protein
MFQQFLADLERVFSRRLRFRLRLDTDCPREVSSGVFAVLIRVGTTLVLATSRLSIGLVFGPASCELTYETQDDHRSPEPEGLIAR